MNAVWGAVFFFSVLLLASLSLRSSVIRRWVGHFILNIAFAGILFYVVNVLEPFNSLDIPLNFVTLATVAFLGIPGALMIFALKAFVV